MKRVFPKCAHKALGLLLACIFLAYPASALPLAESGTNIVIVVDCSTSMQASDGTWVVPDSLQLLIDSCPDTASTRVSLILYGTEAVVSFRDMPLSYGNKEEVKERISVDIQQYGYNRGLTDTGAAFNLAREILSTRGGQNNFVLLFTDGKVKTDSAARTAEDSRADMNAFIAFAQEYYVRIYAFGVDTLPRDKMAQTEIEEREQELAVMEKELTPLAQKTGGSYETLHKVEDIPAEIIRLLGQILDVRELELRPAVREDALVIPFTIADAYASYVTIALPEPGARIGEAHLTTPRGEQIPLSEQPNANLVVTTRYNGEPGYISFSMNKLPREPWVGQWELHLPGITDPPALHSFYTYDIVPEVVMDVAGCNIMEPVEVRIFLKTGDGLRVDDIDFCNTVTATVQIINETNRSQEALETMELVNDEFVYEFVPRQATEYHMVISLESPYFTRQVQTQSVTARDSLEIISSLSPMRPKKNKPFSIRAYMRNENRKRVQDELFYAQSGSFARIVNLTAGTVEEKRLTATEDGKGLLITHTLEDAGDYELTIHSQSARETVTRVGEALTFHIEDNPVRTALRGTLYHVVRNREREIDLSPHFRDPDGDAILYTAELRGVDATGSVFDNMLVVEAFAEGTVEVDITAVDTAGNIAQKTLEVKSMSLYRLIAYGIVALILLLAVAAVVRVMYMRKRLMRRLMDVEVVLNPAAQVDKYFHQHPHEEAQRERYTQQSAGKFLVSMDALNGPFEQRENWRGRSYLLRDILELYWRRYHSLFGIRGAYSALPKAEWDPLGSQVTLTGRVRDDIYRIVNHKRKSCTLYIGGQKPRDKRSGKVPRGQRVAVDFHIDTDDVLICRVELTYL